VLAVSVDPPATAAKMKRQLGIDYPICADEGAQVIARYGLLHEQAGMRLARPAELLLDGAGVIRWASFADNWRFRPPADAPLAALRALR
jgi:peroxiredoxin